MKTYKDFLNEAETDKYTIYFKKFCHTYFNGNYGAMLDWLNKNLVNQNIYFINSHLEVLQIIFTIKEYRYDNDQKMTINVLMSNGQHGHAGGLVFLNLDADSIKLPNNKYKKIKNIELDPFDEEDWGYEEIE
jgi:hypothetical protein